MYRAGFIGYGNIGKFVIDNVLKLKLIDEEYIVVSNRTDSKLHDLRCKFSSAAYTDDNTLVGKMCDTIFIFVETPQFKEVLEEIMPFIYSKTHIIHSCSGLTFENISKIFDGKVSQVIPTVISQTKAIDRNTDKNIDKNTNKDKNIEAENEKNGVTLVLHNSKVEPEDMEFVENLFNEFSYVKRMTDDIKIPTILASCGSAFISLIIRKIAMLASEESDLSVEELEDIIVKTALGCSNQLNSKNMEIDEIIGGTATKKGITQIGLDYIDSNLDDFLIKMFNELLNKFDSVEDDLDREYGEIE